MPVTEWRRSDHLSRLTAVSRFDTLVIGGGITGVGAALDLAARGLEVAVIEQTDFGQGTSSRSTKLFHGGIRYLPHFEFGLVSEGLREQKVLSRIADYLFDPLEFIIPIYRQFGLADAPGWAASGWKAPIALHIGLALYDLLGGLGRPGSRHRGMTVEELTQQIPSLRREGLESGIAYSDAQTDDARLVLAVIKTAVRDHGVVAVGRVRAETVEPAADGFDVGVMDVDSGERFALNARTVLSATGAFDPPPPGRDSHRLKIVRSKGTHLIVSSDALALGSAALVLPETEDDRVLFIIPWRGHAMIGTTDTPYDADPTHPAPSDEDVEYLVRHVHRFLEVPEFEPLSTFAGLRALKDPGSESTAKASREHVIEEPAPGYVQVAGGKLTTYRRIAAEAADRIAEALDLSVDSSTDEIPLAGAGGDLDSLKRQLVAAGVDPEVAGPMTIRYGSDAGALAQLIEGEPALAASLADGRGTLADVVFAVRHEGAVHLSDVTLRRTRLAWFSKDHSRIDANRIAEVMGRELGWSETELKAELEAHEAELVAEGL